MELWLFVFSYLSNYFFLFEAFIIYSVITTFSADPYELAQRFTNAAKESAIQNESNRQIEVSSNPANEIAETHENLNLNPNDSSSNDVITNEKGSNENSDQPIDWILEVSNKDELIDINFNNLEINNNEINDLKTDGSGSEFEETVESLVELSENSEENKDESLITGAIAQITLETVVIKKSKNKSVRFADDCGGTLYIIKQMTEPSDFPPKINPKVSFQVYFNIIIVAYIMNVTFVFACLFAGQRNNWHI